MARSERVRKVDIETPGAHTWMVGGGIFRRLRHCCFGDIRDGAR